MTRLILQEGPMKRILVIIFIACFISVCSLSGVSRASLLTEPGLYIGLLVIALPLAILIIQSDDHSARYSAWVRADRGTVREPLIGWDAIDFLGRRKIIMKENSWVYPQPNDHYYNGAVYKDEMYYIDYERKTDQGTWYLIRIDAAHTTREAVDWPSLI
jgi:hypothetical protein